VATTDEYDVKCFYHPNVSTRLRCSRCEKPICPRCMVSTPIGFRCPECARGPKPVLYQTTATGLARASALGVVIALGAGVLWGLFPAWEFYCVLLLGFGTVEGIAWGANYRRGRELLLVAIACIVLGFVVARLVMAWDSPVLTVDMLLNQTTQPGVSEAFQLEPLPDFLFMAIPFVIAYIRFR
jgi:hypothetical protein